MDQIIKSVLLRFLRAGIAGALSTMVALSVFTGTTWQDMTHWLSALGFSAIVGFVGGVLMAGDKYFRTMNK